MNIETTGTKRYDYQYLVSIYIFLYFLSRDSLSNVEINFYVEKENEEDAQIVINHDGKETIFDIQVKTEEISFENFCKWYFHFEKRNTETCLYSKAKNDEKRNVIFVSDKRASDNFSFMLKTENFIEKNEYKNTRTFFSEFRDKSQNINFSGFKAERKKKTNELLKETDFSEFNNLINKTNIIENFRESYLLARICDLLRRKYYIPNAQHENVINEIKCFVRENLEAIQSISNDIIKIVQKYSGNLLHKSDEHHIERQETKHCNDILESQNLLILTGEPYCGKSEMAKVLAQNYQNEGYTIRFKQEIAGENGAFSFLRKSIIHDDRLLILEDPFGSVKMRSDYLEVRKNFIELVSSYSSQSRKIIVTSRKDIFVKALNHELAKQYLDDEDQCINLTAKNFHDARLVWLKYYGGSERSIKIFDDIIKWKDRNEKTKVMQIGAVKNIYNQFKTIVELEEVKIQDIIKFEKLDAKDLKEIILHRNSLSKRIFISLGLCCNTFRKINIKDLLYVLSDTEEYLGFLEAERKGSYYRERVVSKPDFPKYKRIYELTNDIKEELKYFRDSGFIYIDPDSAMNIQFIHPNYHYSSYLLLEQEFEDCFETDSVLKLIKRTLSSLSCESNINAVSQVERLYLKNYDDRLKKLVLDSLNSIFPMVKEQIIRFFDLQTDLLSHEEKKLLFSAVTDEIDYNSDDVLWEEGIPWFNTSRDRTYFFTRVSTQIDHNEIKEKIKNKLSIPPKDILGYLNQIDNVNKDIEILNILYASEEAFIREIAVKKIFEYCAYNQTDLSMYCFKDEHPRVIYNLFKTALDNWGKFEYENQKMILNYFKKSMKRTSVILLSKKLLENFSDEYKYRSHSISWSKLSEPEKKSLWLVWYELIIEYFNNFDADFIDSDQVHLDCTFTASLKYLNSQEKILKLSESWLNWIIKYSQTKVAQECGSNICYE